MLHHQTIEEVEKIIRGRISNKITRDGNFILASVMIILKENRESDYSILFIKRPQNAEDVFSGHMAFPGGKMKEGDGNKLQTAIRETLEETGIDIFKKGKILGELDDFNPINPKASHYIVTPFLSLLIKDTEIKPNEEVDEAIWIPISHLKDEKALEIRIVEKLSMGVKDYVFHYKDYVIWGMTGRILCKFLSLVGHLF